MKKFTPCQGKDYCRDDGTKCFTCGRQLDEISGLRNLIDQLANLANQYSYENVDDYAAYIARKVSKTIHYRRANSGIDNG